jgi:aryl-alcohol dehydrogenase-like predicted oxidoreductase
MIPTADFGRSGHTSTRLIFGGYALRQATQKEADHVLEMLLEYGINHIDTAPMYGNCEKRIGAWMERHRQDFFLATKSRKRTSKEAWEDLQRSLSKLRTDYVDRWQMHGLINPVGWETAMGVGGALQAFIEARDKGLVRFWGVTGHSSKIAEMHKRSLERFDFDSVLLPYNYP